MNKILFTRFKKKSLLLLLRFLTPDLLLSIKTIKILEIVRSLNSQNLSLAETILVKSSVNIIIKLNEKQIASGNFNGEIKFWNLDTEECIKTFNGHTDSVMSLLKINEKVLASGSNDRSIKLWDLYDGRCKQTLKRHSYGISCLKNLNTTTFASGGFFYLRF